MRYMTIILFFAFCCSCERDPRTAYADFEKDTFSFPDRNQDISIYPDTKEFIISGQLEEKLKEPTIHFIKIVPELTTAQDSVQYRFPEESLHSYSHTEPIFRFPAQTLTAGMKIMVFPERISEPVQITFTSSSYMVYKDYSKYNDTLTVRLIPTVKQN